MIKFAQKIKILIFSSLLVVGTTGNVYSLETCSRTAVINYQEILIDTNSTQKGEGLRFYLEKDPLAIKYLNKYQKGTEIKWANVAMGTAGSLLTIGGFIIGGKSKNNKAMIIGGISLLIINFLTARTMAYSNEKNLHNAIREYNRRNTPRIYYNPENQNRSKGLDSQSNYKPNLYLNIVRSF